MIPKTEGKSRADGMDMAIETGARFAEDPLENARLCVKIAEDRCVDCGNFHLRSILRRIAVAPGSKIGDMDEFCAMIALALRRLRKSGQTIRVAIVGSTDTGILAALMRTSHELGGDGLVSTLSITLVDQCATPLEICKAYARFGGFELNVVQTDIREFADADKFDLVLMHGVLPFFPFSLRHDYMSHIATLLSQNGILISSTHLGSKPDRTTHAKRTELAIANLRKFANAGLAVDAETVETLTDRLNDNPRSRENDPSVFATLDEATDFYQSAGLNVQSTWLVHHQSDDIVRHNRKYKHRCIVMGIRAETGL
jgi:hypothetical protein